MRGMNNLQANVCLLAVTLCWSCEVVIFSIIPDDVNPFATTCVTSLIGAALIFACFAKRIAEVFKRDSRKLARRILALSLMNTTYNVLFLVGLKYFNVSTGAFTLSITVVVLPVMLLVMRRRVGVRTWISALCVLAGIVMAMYPSFEYSHFEGLAVMGIGCLIRAVFIVKLNDWAREHDPMSLAAGMTAGNAIVAFIPWLIMQPSTFTALPWSGDLIAAYFIYAYFIVAFAISLNVLAQRYASPAQATIIYSTEIVFSTIWATCLPATIVDPVDLTVHIVIGCVLIVVGNLIIILPIGPKDEVDEASNESSVGALSPAPALAHATAPNNDAFSHMLARLRTPLARKALVFCVLLVVYLVIALPFKVLSVIPGFADIRPVTMLMPVYGIFFGIPGCLANAVGNLIGDIASDSLRWSSIAGFIGNFAYPYLMYLFWTKLRKTPFELRKGSTLGLFVLTLVVCAIVQALIITPFVHMYYPDVDTMLFAMIVIGNSALFPIGFAIPFIIILQEELGFAPLGA